MATFESTRSQFIQQHFTILEIDLPVVEGTCTISGLAGYGTPLSCDQASNATRTYKFTNIDAPLLPESGIFRCIKSIVETPTKLQSGRGLASRGTAAITFIDFEGKDPNPLSPAVLIEGVKNGTFFGKLNSRQVLTNKNVRIKNYRVESDGTIDLVNGAETRYYLAKSFDSSKGGLWSLKLKDELSIVNINETQFPAQLQGFLVSDVSATQNTLFVDPNISYSVNDTIRIGDELAKISAVGNIGTASAFVSIGMRGADITYTNTLSKTINDVHTGGDEIFLCDVSDNERIDDLLERILLDVGIDAARIPKAAWTAEINEWHPTTRINTIWIESEDTLKVLERILTEYMIDMWFDPVDRLIKISAISVWQQSSSVIEEGNEIDFESITRKRNEQLRLTRAAVVYDKRFLATTDSIENYKKASLFKRTELETPDLYGKEKLKRFENSFLLDKDAADLLVNRRVNRFTDPFEFAFTTQERKLNFKVGDVKDIKSSINVGFNGLIAQADRAQITSIKPVYASIGRHYQVTALTYEPVFNATGTEIVITGNVSDINLFNQYAGAPSQPVTITFIFSGTIVAGSSNLVPSIKAGAFPAGSKVIIILANGADLQARGGDGGSGEFIFFDRATNLWSSTKVAQNGTNGGIAYDAQGVDTDIYFSGATPSPNFPTALGSIKAPSGGAGGFDAQFVQGSSIDGQGGNGGKGGDGRIAGSGGAGGVATGGSDPTPNGADGADGNSQGTSTGFGNAGANNNAIGGNAGAGIIDNGGVVTLFGANSGNYINGSGDH